MIDRNDLFGYRWGLAFETLDDAKKIHASSGSPRSVVNRAYYSMFYAVLALFVKTGTSARTSKHSTIISVFDTEFIKSERLPVNFPECCTGHSMIGRNLIIKIMRELKLPTRKIFLRMQSRL